MNQIVQFLGVSVIWIVLLIVGDYYSTENSIKINDEYPLRYLIWAFGTSSWIYFVLYKLGNSSPLLNLPMILKVQITFGRWDCNIDRYDYLLWFYRCDFQCLVLGLYHSCCVVTFGKYDNKCMAINKEINLCKRRS